MERALGIIKILLISLILYSLFQLPQVITYDRKCRELGGVPMKGVCMKVETISVITQ